MINHTALPIREILKKFGTLIGLILILAILFFLSHDFLSVNNLMTIGLWAIIAIGKMMGLSFREIIKKFGSLIGLILISIIFSFLSPNFLTVNNLMNVGLQMAVIAIIAIGQMMVIIAAGIDLSVGSILAFSGIVATMSLSHSIGIIPSIILGTTVGAFLGWINGLLIGAGKLPPFIATLGMMGIARGLSLILTGGASVTGVPMDFFFLGGGRIFNIIPFPVILIMILALTAHIFLTKTKKGRYIYAVGSNIQAARLSGINVKGILILTYTICGLLSGLAGVINASRLISGQPTAGTGYELDVIAACVIGGASFSGGEGTIPGAIIGAIFIGFLRNICNLLDISAFWQQVAIGTIVIIAVFIDQYQKKKSA